MVNLTYEQIRYKKNPEKRITQVINSRNKKPEHYKKYSEDWIRKNPDKLKKYRKKAWKKNKRKYNKKRLTENLSKDEIRKRSEANRIYNKKLRLEVLTHYSKGVPQCSCCGELQYEFLGIDHIEGRKKFNHKISDSKNIYKYLKRNNFPDGFQVLCYNCNLAKGFYGICPHKKIKIKKVIETD